MFSHLLIINFLLSLLESRVAFVELVRASFKEPIARPVQLFGFQFHFRHTGLVLQVFPVVFGGWIKVYIFPISDFLINIFKNWSGS